MTFAAASTNLRCWISDGPVDWRFYDISGWAVSFVCENVGVLLIGIGQDGYM